MRRLLLTAVATFSLMSGAFAQNAATLHAETFLLAKPTDVISGNIIGLNIKNNNDDTIGEIEDLMISNGHLAGYVVSVGGFLGIGEKNVIVDTKALKLLYTEKEGKWTAEMNTTKEALEKAPVFKYEGKWKK